MRDAALPDDLPILRRLMNEYLLESDPSCDPAEIWDDHYYVACLASEAAGTLKVLLAEEDGCPIGFAILRIEAQWYRPRLLVGHFEEVYVRAEYRCRGIASHMIASGMQWLRRRGAQTLSASVVEDNPRALTFWRNRGFQVCTHRLYRS